MKDLRTVAAEGLPDRELPTDEPFEGPTHVFEADVAAIAAAGIPRPEPEPELADPEPKIAEDQPELTEPAAEAEPLPETALSPEDREIFEVIPAEKRDRRHENFSEEKLRRLLDAYRWHVRHNDRFRGELAERGDLERLERLASR